MGLPTPCYEDSVAFLKWAQPEGPWCLCAFNPNDKDGNEAMTFYPGQEDRALTWLRNVGDARNLYWTVNPVRKLMVKKPKRRDIAALTWLHVDIDPRAGHDIAAERRRILDKLRNPPNGIPRPTCVIFSGGGYQAFWRLNEPFKIEGEEARYEEAKLWNLHLERVLGGDHCHNVDRIMRLPGTVNRPDEKKRAKGRTEELARVEWNDGPNYALGEFTKAEAEGGTTSDRKPVAIDPTKVERVEDLGKLPVGDYCKRVIAQGCDPDDPAKYESRSEALFFVCCEMVRREVPDEIIYAVITDPLNNVSESVRDASNPHEYALRQIARAHKAELARPPVLDKEDPMRSARQFRQRKMQHLMRHNGDWLYFSGAAYSEMEDATVKARVYEFLDGAQQATGKGPHPFCPTKMKVANVLDALEALTHVPVGNHSPPCWLGQQQGPPPTEIVACSNGLLHLPTGELLPLTHEFFTRNALAIDYRPDAPPPSRWLQFLDELWSGDAGSIGTLQEMFGYVLVPDTTQQKIFLLVGPPRSGKGTIARVLTELVGPANTCAPTLNSIGGEFGLQPLIGKQLAIVSDMRMGQRTDPAVVAENLLRISGEDMVTANRKYKSAWSGRLAVRFLVMTNEIPKFADASGALASRFVPLAMSESFLGREDPGLANALMRELPGILCWAVEGWRRLRDRGHFLLPEAARETMQTMSDLASPVSAFVRDECELAPNAKVPTRDLFNAWQVWCQARGEYPGTDGAFGRDLRANLPRVRTTRLWCGGARMTYYAGIQLAAKVLAVPHDYGADAGAGGGPKEEGGRSF